MVDTPRVVKYELLPEKAQTLGTKEQFDSLRPEAREAVFRILSIDNPKLHNFDVLGISLKDGKFEDVRKNYRKTFLLLHPDKNENSPFCTEASALLSSANDNIGKSEVTFEDKRTAEIKATPVQGRASSGTSARTTSFGGQRKTAWGEEDAAKKAQEDARRAREAEEDARRAREAEEDAREDERRAREREKERKDFEDKQKKMQEAAEKAREAIKAREKIVQEQLRRAEEFIKKSREDEAKRDAERRKEQEKWKKEQDQLRKNQERKVRRAERGERAARVREEIAGMREFAERVQKESTEGLKRRGEEYSAEVPARAAAEDPRGKDQKRKAGRVKSSEREAGVREEVAGTSEFIERLQRGFTEGVERIVEEYSAEVPARAAAKDPQVTAAKEAEVKTKGTQKVSRKTAGRDSSVYVFPKSEEKERNDEEEAMIRRNLKKGVRWKKEYNSDDYARYFRESVARSGDFRVDEVPMVKRKNKKMEEGPVEEMEEDPVEKMLREFLKENNMEASSHASKDVPGTSPAPTGVASKQKPDPMIQR